MMQRFVGCYNLQPMGKICVFHGKKNEIRQFFLRFLTVFLDKTLFVCYNILGYLYCLLEARYEKF